jgi:hypothetical protein
MFVPDISRISKNLWVIPKPGSFLGGYLTFSNFK